MTRRGSSARVQAGSFAARKSTLFARLASGVLTYSPLERIVDQDKV